MENIPKWLRLLCSEAVFNSVANSDAMAVSLFLQEMLKNVVMNVQVVDVIVIV